MPQDPSYPKVQRSVDFSYNHVSCLSGYFLNATRLQSLSSVTFVHYMWILVF